MPMRPTTMHTPKLPARETERLTLREDGSRETKEAFHGADGADALQLQKLTSSFCKVMPFVDLATAT
jgi:hypothetical protein